MPAIRSALVIGGGIAGPVTATALRMAGVEADVYEARPPTDPRGIGGSLALEPNGLAALRIVDADEQVRAAAVPITRSILSVAGARGTETPAPHGLPPRQLIDRGVLHRILRDRAHDAGVHVHDDKRLVGVDEQGGGIVAQFADGSTAQADILIGADGVHSTVRHVIDPAAPGAGYTGLLGFEGLVDDADDTAALAPGTMTFAFGKRAYYLFWKRPDGRIGWGANLPAPQPLTFQQARAVDPDEWLRTLRAVYSDDTPGARLAAQTTPDILQPVGALHIMAPVPHWHRGRMVLVGDAVHAPSNSTGQGASLALESGIQLARCLRDLPDVDTAFGCYEQLRRARVEKIAARGARISHAKTPGPIAQRMMRLFVPLMLRTVNLSKTMDTEQRYVIDWTAPASAELGAATR